MARDCTSQAIIAAVNDVQLRPATTGDVPAILAVTKAAYAPHAGQLTPPSSALNEEPEAVMHYLNNGGLIVAEAGGEVVGAVRYEPHEGYLYLAQLAVVPAWQGRGIGRRLVESVEEWALLLGLDEARLGVRIELPTNRDFYRRWPRAV